MRFSPVLALVLPLTACATVGGAGERAMPPGPPAAAAAGGGDCGAPRLDPGERWADPSPHRCGWVVVDGVRLAYLDWGGEGEPLVLLHGSGSNAHSFDDLAPRLTDRFRVLALTRRGHGRSDHPGEGYTIARTTDEVLGFVDALGLDRVHLAGHSLAGAEITRFARRHPDRVLRLVYLDALPDWTEADEVDARNPAPRPGPTEDHLASFAGRREWLERYVYGFWSPALEADFRFGPPDFDAVRLLTEDAMPVPPDYGGIAAPALAIVATRTLADRFPWLARPDADPQRRQAAQHWLDAHNNPYAHRLAERFAAQVADGRVVLVEGHHYVHNSNPDEVAAAMREFLSGG